MAEGHHDTSEKSTGGVWFQGDKLQLQSGHQLDVPLLWRLEWPEFITCHLVTDTNPKGMIRNSDLELAGGLIHLEAITQTFNL